MPFTLDSRGRKLVDVEDLEGEAKWQWELHVLKNFEQSMQDCEELGLDVRNIRQVIEHQKIQAKQRFPDDPVKVKAMIFGYELFGIAMEKCRVRHPKEPSITMEEKLEDWRTYNKLDERFDEICASLVTRTDGKPSKYNFPNPQTIFKILFLNEQVSGKNCL